MSPINYERKNGYGLDLDLLRTILVAIVSSIAYKKWANWKKVTHLRPIYHLRVVSIIDHMFPS